MEDNNLDNNTLSSYSRFSLQDLIDKIEEQKKIIESLSKDITTLNQELASEKINLKAKYKENITLKEKLTSEKKNLESKDKEITILIERLKAKNADTDFVKQCYEDYKSIVEKSNDKHDIKRNPLSNVLNKFLCDSSNNNKNNILCVNMKNQNESKSSMIMLKKKKKRKNKVQDPNKKPLTPVVARDKRAVVTSSNSPRSKNGPYLLFSKEYRNNKKNEGEVNYLQCSKLCGKLWRKMTPEQKEPYIKRHKQTIEKYERDIKNLEKDQEFIIDDPNINNNENRDIILER